MDAHSPNPVSSLQSTRSTTRTLLIINLLYLVAVILWGAFVRATGSGAGCGDHWPLCNGEIIHRPQQIETLIELTHRITSGLTLPFAGWIAWRIRRQWGRKSRTYLFMKWTIFFLLAEAAIGAGLVKFELVAQNESLWRAWIMALHLVNTFALLAVATASVWWSIYEDTEGQRTPSRAERRPIHSALAMMVLMGISGAVTALGDTLYPAGSLREGFAADWDAAAPILLRLRVYHPILAIATAAAVLWAAVNAYFAPQLRKSATVMIALVGLQMLAGLINLILLAPVWLQLVHLGLADALLIALIWHWHLLRLAPEE